MTSDPVLASLDALRDFERGREILSAGREVSRSGARQIKTLPPGPPHPIDIFWTELDARGWTVQTLAARIGGDTLGNRALLWHWLRHPTRELELGPIWAAKLDTAFGLGADFFLNLEKAWRAHRRERAEARQRTN